MRRLDIALTVLYTLVFATTEFVVAATAINNWVFSLISAFALVAAMILAIIGLIADYDYAHLTIFDLIAGESVRLDKERWLKLQVIFQHVTFILIIIAVINATIGSALVQNTSEYYFLSMFIVPVLAFVYLYSARNILGMGYSEFSCSNTIGARALSMLAFVLLNRKNRRGISYLLKALNLFNEVLSRKEIVCDDLNKAITHVTILKATAKELPYQQLATFANDLSELNSLDDLPEQLTKFMKDEEIKKVSAFKVTPSSKRLFFEKIAIAIALATAIGTGIQAIMPDNTKGQIVTFLVSTFTAPGFVIFVVIISFLLLDVYLLDKFGRAFIFDKDIGWKY